MLIRCRSKTGTVRYELQSNDDVSKLVEKILADAPNADPSTVTLSSQPRGGESPISGLSGDLASLGIKHGDLLFVGYQESQQQPEQELAAPPATLNGTRPESTSVAGVSSGSAVKAIKKPWELVKEDPVDTYWEKQDGKIRRSKDSRMCRHGDKSMCDHCMPLEPYDARYQAENSIKHLSFHAHLRKLDIVANKSTGSSSNTFIPPLEEPDYKVAVPCSSGSHPSWPAGICTKCQPSAVTLALQQYRLVDHVEFATPELIENMLAFWRRTGTQRFGWLLGRYEPYERVPMGVKAVVEAIHEPPQEGDVDGIKLGMPWEDESKIGSLAEMCGLKVIGMIYTDLTPDEEDEERKKAGKVLTKRHKDSYFLSSVEALFAAKEQFKRPNHSRFSKSGRYSSKFVTCVITGNLEGDIAVEAYQISDQAMAMVDADMVEASVDPGVVRVKDDTSGSGDVSQKRYIPDVFYTYKNQYNLQVKESAKPCFPTDYLLVSLTNGFPTTSNPLFAAPSSTTFPIENRAGLHDQSLERVYPQLNKLLASLPRSFDDEGFEVVSTSDKGKGKATENGSDPFDVLTKWLSDWHLLAFLDTVGIFDKSDVRLLAEVATKKDKESLQRLLKTSAWQTLATIAKEQGPSASSGQSVGSEVPNFPLDADGFPIIPMDHDMMRPASAISSTEDEQMHTAPASVGDPNEVPDLQAFGGDSGGGGIVCPHCTFENPAGTVDCEICSLPLQG